MTDAPDNPPAVPPADPLADLARQFAETRDELAALRARQTELRKRANDLRPLVVAALVDDIRTRRRTQVEISRMTGYTPERIRQLCRAAGVEPAE